ncbi:hypothetical protein VTL71DRAFT_15882, partial [Oculimacula yallundae]
MISLQRRRIQHLPQPPSSSINHFCWSNSCSHNIGVAIAEPRRPPNSGYTLPEDDDGMPPPRLFQRCRSEQEGEEGWRDGGTGSPTSSTFLQEVAKMSQLDQAQRLEGLHRTVEKSHFIKRLDYDESRSRHRHHLDNPPQG